jgi:NAD(P)-dependent dehydrogenase (short-subunit alcohol dehydrogenase family)
MKDKVLIITGATKGMGLAISKHMLYLGAKVIMVYLSDEENAYEVNQTLSEYKGNYKLLKADITTESDREHILNQTLNTQYPSKRMVLGFDILSVWKDKALTITSYDSRLISPYPKNLCA